jgi:hypothetical protein
MLLLKIPKIHSLASEKERVAYDYPQNGKYGDLIAAIGHQNGYTPHASKEMLKQYGIMK